MHIGTTLMAMGSTATRTYYTPWFPRGTDNAVFTYEVIQALVTAAGTFEITVLHKDTEDPGAEGTVLVATGSFTQIGTSGFFHGVGKDIKELVRFKIVLKPTGVSDGVVYRFLPPTWYPKG